MVINIVKEKFTWRIIRDEMMTSLLIAVDIQKEISTNILSYTVQSTVHTHDAIETEWEI